MSRRFLVCSHVPQLPALAHPPRATRGSRHWYLDGAVVIEPGKERGGIPVGIWSLPVSIRPNQVWFVPKGDRCCFKMAYLLLPHCVSRVWGCFTSPSHCLPSPFISFSASHKALREVLAAVKSKVLIHSSKEGAALPKNPEFGTSKVIVKHILEVGQQPTSPNLVFLSARGSKARMQIHSEITLLFC